ncbi:tRNA lysidine(34) synthetase TilS [Paenibacillus sacheonensis]|uniref:tRNA(Ile)-lysidine synthase n=1 Tax=Paenibacillus sacheonensis TaxID=742054 RepID=A0A7X4YVX6_9BACL|nr:tRNA lysidine(34) synthetase TilS [Paenibacillus sacheonensis]MBM7569300.1 tRNA(Ile)-lysidine synthase [Paenibacillus sacheonensis]NBC73512.1 tRNA lysidine(34) synthetase TilS [Paenibacillus sacheonensis]
MKEVDEWLGELIELAREEGLWTAGDTVVVAVSGGPDSMALLHLLHRLSGAEQLSLVAAHLDHGFRGEESAREGEIVRGYAAELGIPCESTFIDMPAYIEASSMNSQAASREKRYGFLHGVAHTYGASRIALAHHADDQAETVLMRIIRGTGLAGLAGIPISRSEKNVELIRPLLRKYKADILRYCDLWAIPYSHDSSNGQKHYFRNHVRLDILPYLSAHNPQLPQSLARLAELAAAEDDWLAQETRAVYERHVLPHREGCQLNRKALLGLHVALQRRLIKLILNYIGLETDPSSFDSIETIRLAASERAAATWSLDAGGGIRFIREYDNLLFVRSVPGERSTSSSGYAYAVTTDVTSLMLPEAEGQLTFEAMAGSAARRPGNRLEALFDADRIQYPLTIRNRQPGDRMAVLGLNGTKKVQDMFVDDRVAPSRREVLPIVVDANGFVLWIPGIRRSALAQVTDSTKRVMRMKARFASDFNG